MSISSDFWNAINEDRKKKKDEEEQLSTGTTSSGNSVSDHFWSAMADYDNQSKPLQNSTLITPTPGGSDIAPVKGGDKDSWFKAGGFDDGVDNVGDFFVDLGETALGTVSDLGIGIYKGVSRVGEGIADLILYGAAGVGSLFGANEWAEETKKYATRNMTDEHTKWVEDWADQYSVLGDKADSVAEGLGQVGLILATGGIAGAAGLSTSAVTAITTGITGLSGVGSGMSEAYASGATDEEALTYGLIAGTSEAATELLFGGLGKGIKAIGIGKSAVPVDDLLAKKVSGMFTNQIAKNFAEFGIKATAEGTEEVLSGIAQAVGKKMTYMSEEDLGEILADENLLEQFIIGSVTSGIAQSGIVPGMKKGSLAEANKTGRDLITGYTKAEQTVIDKEVENRVAEKEKNGNKLTKQEIGKIEEQVQNDLEKGYISIDTIESTLGGDAYNALKENIESEKALKAELEELRQMESGKRNDIQNDRLAELKSMNLEDTTKRDSLREELKKTLTPMLKDSKLMESYNEIARRGKAFEVDLKQYKGKQKEAVERAVKSGVLNNTNKSHELVNTLSQIEADKGIVFDYTNNAKLKESGFAVDGKVVNGFENNGAVTLNVQSAKAWQSTVGHEITHVLKGTNAYSALSEALYAYAESKGELASRKAAIAELYNGVKADINEELTADLVGDYLFTDKEFINKLTGNRTLFQKVWDEIKYLCKVATGKQLTEIEKVEREFSRAWKELGQKNSETSNEIDNDKKANAPSSESSKDIGNQNPTDSPDIRFSLSKSVEETKDLVAVHNLQSSELAKTLELGGLPMPSIAIIKAEQGHEQYGDVSLIFPKEAIDPKANKANKVYGGDAWTPTYPRIEYKPSDAVESRIKDKYYELAEKIGYDTVRPMYKYANSLEDTLNSYGGEAAMLEKLYEDTDMMQVYLEDSGKGKVEPVIKETRTEATETEKAQSQLIIDRLGEDVIRSIKAPTGESPIAHRKAFVAEHRNEILSAWEDVCRDVYNSTEEQIQNIMEATNDAMLVKLIRDAYTYLQNGGVKITSETDYNATKAAIKENATDGYKAWVDNLFKGVEEKSGIRNNVDYYTPSGKQRGWDALHWENNLENVVKAMKAQDQTGVAAFAPSSALFGIAHKDFGSIAEIKADSNRLGRVSEAEYEELKDSFSTRLAQIADSIKDPSERNGFIAVDRAAEEIVDAVRNYKTKDGMLRYMQKWNNRVTESTVDDILSLVSDIANMPTGYFEAKPQRAVGLEEVGVFVIPYNVDAGLKQELLNKGYSIAEYDPNTEGDRQRVVNQFEKYKFSLSNMGEQIAPIGNYSTPLKELALEQSEDVAPVKNEATPIENTAPVAPVTTEDYSAPADSLDARIYRAEEGLQTLENEMQELLQAYDERRITDDELISKTNAIDEEWTALNDEYNRLLDEAKQIDDERFESITEADIPPVMEEYNDVLPDSITIDNKSLKQLSKTIGDSLALNRVGRKELEQLMQSYSRNAFATKEDLQAEVAKRFGTSYYQERYDDVAEAKQYIRNTKIQVSQADKIEFGSIKDYNAFMRKNFGKIRFSKDGVSVDKVYMELSEVYPHLFPADNINTADQLRRIAEVASRDVVELIPTKLPDEALSDVSDMIYDSIAEYKETERMSAAEQVENEILASIPNIAPVAPVTTQDYTEEMIPDEKGKPTTRKELRNNIINDTKAKYRENGYDFDEVLKNAKDLSTFATVDNTPQRVMEKALGYKQGQVLADITVNKVAQNETKGIRWLDSYTNRKTGVLAQLVKQYGIKPGSKESAAAQIFAEGFYVNENDELVAYGDAELAEDFKNEKVRNNIKALAQDSRFRQIYDETLDAINESRRRNAYPEIPRLDNYYLHYRAMEDTFSKLGVPFNPNDIRAKDLPTDLNGVTADLKPGQPFFASSMHRKGKRTTYDLLGGLERYLTSAKNQIYHIDDIQTLRALRDYIADTYGQAKGLENLDALTDEEAQEKIEQVFDSHLSTFAKFLNEEANILAGKTSLIDRGIEGVIGRRGMTFFDTLNRQVGSNMVGFNVSSALTNFIPVAQTFAKTNKFDFLKAFAQTVSNKFGSIVGKGDGFAENSPVMIRRKGADKFYRTPFQKVGDAGYVLMSAVDGVSTELIARTKFNELTRKGMSEQQAHFETDKWVSRLMGDRSLGQQPQLYNSKALGVLTKFQLEVRNQLDSQFYDTIQEAKVSNEEIENKLARNAKTAAKVTAVFFELAVVQHLFGKAFESVAGYNPAFDIIDVLSKMFGFDDDEESKDTALDNIGQGFLELLEDLPYTSALTGGRIPISSALPVEELIKGEDSYGNKKSRLETLAEVAPYYFLPGGYSQFKKTFQGLNMFNINEKHPIAGSYTDSDNLRFPVEDTPINRVQAALFGQYASENAREYFDNDYAPLKENQIQEYMDVDMPIKDYWEYREGLAKQETLEDKFDYIAGLDLPVEKKNILINNVVDRKEDVDLENYDDFSSLDEFDFATKNPEKYAVAKAVGGYSAYKTYYSELYDIKADKDASGKTINGSRKAKVIEYINNLDADYETKIILFKYQYPSDDSYNVDIVNYINSREDLTYEERVSIFTELGFRVTSDGYIYAD